MNKIINTVQFVIPGDRGSIMSRSVLTRVVRQTVCVMLNGGGHIPFTHLLLGTFPPLWGPDADPCNSRHSFHSEDLGLG